MMLGRYIARLMALLSMADFMQRRIADERWWLASHHVVEMELMLQPIPLVALRRIR